MSEPRDMTPHEKIVGMLKAFPNQAITIWRDGAQYKAALVDEPRHQPPHSSECRSWPEDALSRLHEKLCQRAEEGFRIAAEHKSKLMTRIIPKEQTGPCQSEGDEP